MSKIASSRQSLFDIAVQYSGDALSAFDIALKNGLSITDDLLIGQTLEVPEAENQLMTEYYAANRFKPATGFSAEGEGVEYWRIEYEFKVS